MMTSLSFQRKSAASHHTMGEKPELHSYRKEVSSGEEIASQDVPQPGKRQLGKPSLTNQVYTNTQPHSNVWKIDCSSYAYLPAYAITHFKKIMSEGLSLDWEITSCNHFAQSAAT